MWNYANQDVHLVTEILIEVVFDVIHKAVHYFLSPFGTSKMLLSWFSSSSGKQISDDSSNVSVLTATLAETDPTPKERTVISPYSLNTDGRTCRDVITELG